MALDLDAADAPGALADRSWQQSYRVLTASTAHNGSHERLRYPAGSARRSEAARGSLPTAGRGRARTPYRVLLPPTPKRISEMHRRLNALGSDSIWWVACKPERLIGSLCARELRPSPLVVRVMEISDVVVDRHHRRRGIASALVERAFGWAHERGNAGGCRGQHGGSSTVRGPRHVPTGRTLARDLHTLTN
jgi:GNAT superfamily N-acetyltransferase